MGSFKLFICGPARHGKDTVAGLLRKRYGLSFMSSSYAAMKAIGLLDRFAEKYGIKYADEDECYADRVNHRGIWYDEVFEFNAEDKSRLSRAIFADHDIYVGIRDREEFLSSKCLSRLAIWVDATPRLPIEGEEEYLDRCVREDDCDFTLKNSGTLMDLERKVARIFGSAYASPRVAS